MTIDRPSYNKCNKGRYDPVLVGLMDLIGFLIHVLIWVIKFELIGYLLQYIIIKLHI